MPSTHLTTPAHHSNTIVKFADDTTVVGLISVGYGLAYRDKVDQLIVWYRDNIMLFNTLKTKELIIHYRKNNRYPTSDHQWGL